MPCLTHTSTSHSAGRHHFGIASTDLGSFLGTQQQFNFLSQQKAQGYLPARLSFSSIAEGSKKVSYQSKKIFLVPNPIKKESSSLYLSHKFSVLQEEMVPAILLLKPWTVPKLALWRLLKLPRAGQWWEYFLVLYCQCLNIVCAHAGYGEETSAGSMPCYCLCLLLWGNKQQSSSSVIQWIMVNSNFFFFCTCLLKFLRSLFPPHKAHTQILPWTQI